MKTLFVFSFVTLMLLPFSSEAQMASARGLGGFTKGAIHLGGDYESRSPQSTFGAYFFLQTEGKDAGIQQFLTGGAFLPIHLLQKSRFDAYISPGFGLGMIKMPIDNSNKMIIGPSFKIGGEYRTSSTNSFGLVYHTYFNWMEKEVAHSANYASLTATFGL